jgi:transcriptional regulator with XRE-family HTH domain
MTPDQIRKARLTLKLTQAQMAAMLETDEQSVRRWEMQPEAATHRPLPARARRLIGAYLSGYRGEDWPVPTESPNQR